MYRRLTYSVYTYLIALNYRTRHEFFSVPRNAVEFFLSKHRGNQKMSVPLNSHLCPRFYTVVDTVGHGGVVNSVDLF